MCIYTIIDTNVIVSSLLTKHDDSATVKVLGKVFDGSIKAVLNEKIIAEYEEVLSRKHFRFNRDTVRDIITAVKDNAIFLDGIPADEPLPDPKDVVFYEVTLDARRGGNAFLVTGNGKHFPAKPFIVSPAEMLGIIEKAGS